MIDGSCVGKVIESRNDGFQAGDYVTGFKGWRELWVGDSQQATKIDVSATEPQTFLGVLGMTGITAYFGFKEIA